MSIIIKTNRSVHNMQKRRKFIVYILLIILYLHAKILVTYLKDNIYIHQLNIRNLLFYIFTFKHEKLSTERWVIRLKGLEVLE